MNRILGLGMLSLGVVGAGTVSAVRAGQEWSPVESPLDRCVGWYEIEPGHPARVTWSLDGELQLIDLDRLRIDELDRTDAEGWVWKRADDDKRPTRFEDGPDGPRLVWSDGEGIDHTAPRLDGYGYDQVQVRFFNEGTELRATVMLPRIDGVAPGAVIIQGSGESSRGNQWAMTIADHLARNGIAVLFPDKRGSGHSGGDWKTADFGTLAGDAIAGMEALRAQPGVDPTRTGFVGLSQGGWVAPLASTMLGDVAFVVDVSGTLVTPDQQVRHEIEQDLRNSGLDGEQTRRVLALLDQSIAFVHTGEGWEAYLEHRRTLLADPALGEAVEPFPTEPDHWRWAFWRGIGRFDPMPYWASLDVPLLFVFGREDEHDNVPIARTVELVEAVEDGGGDVTLRVFDGMGHALMDPERGWVSEVFLSSVSGWIAEHAGGDR